MASNQGLSSRPWRRLRAQVLELGHPCWICGHPIDRALPAQHPMSATVDHIIPRAIAPHLSLDPTNLRAAHKRCNSRKGKKLVSDQVSNTSRIW
jgi:5-methylcytosine-specific restriction endonuclease McrA